MAKIIGVRGHRLFFSKAPLDPVQSRGCGHWKWNARSFGLKVGCAAVCGHGALSGRASAPGQDRTVRRLSETKTHSQLEEMVNPAEARPPNSPSEHQARIGKSPPGKRTPPLSLEDQLVLVLQ